MKYLFMGLGLAASLVAGVVLGVVVSAIIYGLPIGGLLTPPGGGLLSPGSGWQRSGTNVRLINSADVIGTGTSSPAQNVNVAIQDSAQATTSIYLASQMGNRGGCIQLEGPASTTFRAYATTTGPLILESGSCR